MEIQSRRTRGDPFENAKNRQAWADGLIRQRSYAWIAACRIPASSSELSTTGFGFMLLAREAFSTRSGISAPAMPWKPSVGMRSAAHKSATFTVVRNHKELTLNIELALDFEPWLTQPRACAVNGLYSA